jgi:hypothetical protein
MSDGIGSLVQSGWIPAITYGGWAVIVALATRGRLGFVGEGG